MTETEPKPTPTPIPTLAELGLEPVPEGVDATYAQAFVGRVHGWLKKNVDSNPDFRNADGEISARYAIRNDNHNIGLSVSAAKLTKDYKQKSTKFSIQEPQREYAGWYQAALETMLTQRGLRSSLHGKFSPLPVLAEAIGLDASATAAAVEHAWEIAKPTQQKDAMAQLADYCRPFLSEAIESIMLAKPDEWKLPGPNDSAWELMKKTLLKLPAAAQEATGWIGSSLYFGGNEETRLTIKWHPLSEMWRGETEWLHKPESASFQLSELTPTLASVVQQACKTASEAGIGPNGEYTFFHSLVKPAQNKKQCVIPQEWLSIEWLQSPTNNLLKMRSGTYHIKLTHETSRTPLICLSLSASDPKVAAQRWTWLYNQALQPALNAGTPITTGMLDAALERQFPPEAKPSKPQQTRQSAIIQDRYELITPTLVEHAQANSETVHKAKLRFALAGSNKNFSVSTIINLNTADPALATQRMQDVWHMAKLALEDYFTAHHEHHFATKLATTIKHGKSITGQRITSKTLQNAGEGEENTLYWKNFCDDYLRPALDGYMRKPAFEGRTHETEGGVELTFQAIRNRGLTNETLADTESKLLRQSFTVTCESAEQANDLLRALNARLREALYPITIMPDGTRQRIFNPTGLTSTERPVQQFGERSLDLVLRETLRDVLNQEAFQSIKDNLPKTSPLAAVLSARSVTD